MYRRNVLIASTGLCVGLAGCLSDETEEQGEQNGDENGQADENGDEMDEEQTASTGAYIDQWGTTETHLYIEFGDSDEVSSVSLIDPSGEELTNESVGTGASRISMQVVRDGYDGLRYLEDGEYSVVLIDGDENELETVSLEVTRGIEITNAATGLEYAGEYDDAVGDEDLLLTIKNTGTFPVGLSGYVNEVVSAPGKAGVEERDDPVDLQYTENRSAGVTDFERLDEPESDVIENRLEWHIGGDAEATIIIENFFRSRFEDVSSFETVIPIESSSGYDEEFELSLETYYDFEQSFLFTMTIDGEALVREDVFGGPDGLFLFDGMAITDITASPE